MAVDAYSLCPCGSGKKIKFCCPDLLNDFQKMSRMLEGEQHLACLQYVDRLQAAQPDRASLFAIKGRLLRATGQMEKAHDNATAFMERHPQSVAAMAESAITTAIREGGRAAMPILQQAMAACGGKIAGCLYDAMGLVARVLRAEGEWLAARALLELQTVIAKDDDEPREMLFGLHQSPDVPLLLKDVPSWASCPDDAPWKARFDEIRFPERWTTWQQVVEELAPLAEQVGDAPVLWQHLAAFRGNTADTPGCIAALRKFASLEVPLEDAAEAEALAMLLSEDPLGDHVDMLSLRWTITDFEHVQGAFSLEKRTVPIPFDPADLGSDDQPPPKSAYLVCDRPVPETAEGVTPQTVSRFLGQALLFGRQTDREARLELSGVLSDDLEQLKALIREMAGDALDGEPEQHVMMRVSATRESLEPKWRAGPGLTGEQFRKLLYEARRYVLLEQWPRRELGVLDGNSPGQLAGDPAWQRTLLAAVLVLQSWVEARSWDFDFNELRRLLGLPTLEPIDPRQTPVRELPLVRLSRVVVEELSDQYLVALLHKAILFRARVAGRRLAEAVTDRPSFVGKKERVRAYRLLAELEQDPDRALRHIEEGRRATEAVQESCARWDLLELSLRSARGQGAEVMRLITHLQERHFEEPGVAEALTDFLIRVGALLPDGTPAPPPQPAQSSVVVGADQPEPQAGQIWTPESQKPGGGKLWTPD